MSAFRFAASLVKPTNSVERVLETLLLDLKNAPPVVIHIPAVVAVAVGGMSLLALARLTRR